LKVSIEITPKIGELNQVKNKEEIIASCIKRLTAMKKEEKKGNALFLRARSKEIRHNASYKMALKKDSLIIKKCTIKGMIKNSLKQN